MIYNNMKNMNESYLLALSRKLIFSGTSSCPLYLFLLSYYLRGIIKEMSECQRYVSNFLGVLKLEANIFTELYASFENPQITSSVFSDFNFLQQQIWILLESLTSYIQEQKRGLSEFIQNLCILLFTLLSLKSSSYVCSPM